MAFVSSSRSVNSANIQVSEILCPLSTNISGDLIVVVVRTNYNTGTWQQKAGTTGWTLHSSTSTGSDTFGIFYKFAGVSEADPIFQEAGLNNGHTEAISTTVKSAHATPIATFSITSANEPKIYNLPTIDTTGNDDTLILATCSAFAESRSNVFPPEVNYYAGTYNANNALGACWFYQQTGGVTPTIEVIHEFTDTVTIGKVLIAIKDDGTGDIRGHVNPASSPAELIQGCFFNHASQTNVTALVTTLDGNTTNQSASFATQNDPFNNITNRPNTLSLTSNTTTPDCRGLSFYNSTADLTDELLSFSVAPATFDSSLPWSDGGRYFGLISGSDVGAKIWKFEAADTSLRVKSGNFPYIIDTSMTAYEGHGTFDITDVTKWFYAVHRDSTTASIVAYIYKLGLMELVYGNSTNPCSFEDAARHAKTASLRTVQAQGGQASSQFYVTQNIKIGNNATNFTYWDSSNQAMEMPAKYDIPSRFVHHQIDTGRLTCTVNGGVGDTIILTSSTYNMGDFHNFVLDSAVAIQSEGFSLLNSNVTLTNNAGAALGGITFSGCKTLPVFDYTGGCTISNSADANAIIITSEAQFDDLANCSFSGNNRAIQITGNQTGSWSDPNFTMSGNTFDIEYTGTTNFSIQSANAITVNNASSGVLTVVTPVQAFEINSSESGSLIQIFTTTTQTILASTTGTTLNYPFTGTVVVDYVIQKAGFTPQRFTGITLTDSSTTVNLIPSREYDASHGLTYTTDASWSRANNELTVPTFGVTGQGVFSLILDSFISETSLRNTAFNLEMDGTGSLFLTNDAEGNADSSIENLTECGCAYLTPASVITASWAGLLSVGDATGFQGEYQQIDGTTTTDARATGVFNELIKVFGDAGHGNFDFTDHLVLKYQPNTFREARSDVIDSYDLTALQPTLYIVAMEPSSIDITAGDPAISITIVDHTSVPLVISGKSFDFEIQDNGANDGDAMLREVNYNLSQDAVYQGRDPFNWPEMILKSGSTFETIFGIVEGLSGLHGVYVSRSAADHPDFVRHQSNDGTYYVKPITANASISNIVTGSRLRIFNETTATETENSIIAGTSFSDSYTEGTTYTAGDVVTIYITQTAGVTAQLPFTTTVVSSASGWTVLASQVDDTVYNGYGLNGSTITKFTADYVNDEVDLIIASNFSGAELYAWWSFNLTTSQGISDFFGGITAQDAANLLINNSIVSIYLDNTTTTNVIQTDNIRVFRADEDYPVKNPTSGGGGIDVVWRDRVFIAETGVSGLTASESTELFKNTDILLDTGTTLPAQIDGISGGGDATQAKQDQILSELAVVDTNVDAILVDTSTTLPADIAAVKSDTSQIKTKTDELTFTKANELDSNIQSVNDVTVDGTGVDGDTWGPA